MRQYLIVPVIVWQVIALGAQVSWAVQTPLNRCRNFLNEFHCRLFSSRPCILTLSDFRHYGDGKGV